MMQWWQSLNQRERWLISSAVLILGAALLFTLVLEPLSHRRQQLDLRLAAETAVLKRIEENAAAATALRQRMDVTPKVQSASGKSLLSVVNETATNHQLEQRIRRIVPSGKNQAAVVIDAVAFDNLIAWLVELQFKFGIFVNRVNVDRDKEAGLVKANLTLMR